MYEVLGNAAAHEAIRQANPAGRHCELLRVNSHICSTCPVNQNPYNGDGGRDGSLYRASEEYGHWIEDAIDFFDHQRFGLGVPPQQLSPEQFEVLRILHHEELLMQSQLQGQEIARIIARMFAGSKEQ